MAQSVRGRPQSRSGLPFWKLEDAKARFSEMVRRARETGPQRVTIRGQDAVVILSAAEYAQLAPAANVTSLAALFGEGPFARMDEFEETLARPLGLAAGPTSRGGKPISTPVVSRTMIRSRPAS